MSEPQWTTGRLRARVPEGWSVRESWTLTAPDGQANVVIAREPLPPVVTTEQYARGLGDRLATDYPQYQQHVLTVLPLRSGPAYARLFSWASPGGARVAQVQVYATTPGTGVTATAGVPAASFEVVADVLDGVLRSLEFGPGAPPSAAPVTDRSAPAAGPAPVELRKSAAEPAPARSQPDPALAPEPEPEPEPAQPQPAAEPELTEDAPAAPPVSGSGSTSATRLVQLPRMPPGPPPPRPS